MYGPTGRCDIAWPNERRKMAVTISKSVICCGVGYGGAARRNRGTTWNATPIVKRPANPKIWACPWNWACFSTHRLRSMPSAGSISMPAPAVKPRVRAIINDHLTNGR